MKNYSFKFEVGGIFVLVTVKAFTEEGAHRKAYRKISKFVG